MNVLKKREHPVGPMAAKVLTKKVEGVSRKTSEGTVGNKIAVSGSMLSRHLRQCLLPCIHLLEAGFYPLPLR